MRLNAPMTLGLGGARRRGDLGETLLQTADHYWNAEDWSGSGSWSARVGGVAASVAGGAKVASGATYDTDKTADRDLIWLSGSSSYVDLTSATVPDLGDGAESTVVVVFKAFAISYAFSHVYTYRQDGGNYPGLVIQFLDSNELTYVSFDQGAATVDTGNRSVTLGEWETVASSVSTTEIRHYTRTADAFATSSRGAAFEVPASGAHAVGAFFNLGASQAMAVSKIAIWKASALSLSELQAIGASA